MRNRKPEGMQAWAGEDSLLVVQLDGRSGRAPQHAGRSFMLVVMAEVDVAAGMVRVKKLVQQRPGYTEIIDERGGKVAMCFGRTCCSGGGMLGCMEAARATLRSRCGVKLCLTFVEPTCEHFAETLKMFWLEDLPHLVTHQTWVAKELEPAVLVMSEPTLCRSSESDGQLYRWQRDGLRTVLKANETLKVAAALRIAWEMKSDLDTATAAGGRLQHEGLEQGITRPDPGEIRVPVEGTSEEEKAGKKSRLTTRRLSSLGKVTPLPRRQRLWRGVQQIREKPRRACLSRSRA